MIQRIQTIWLLLAAICIFSSLTFFSFYAGNIEATASDTVNGVIEKKFTVLNGMYTIYTNILTIAIGVLSFITIFLFGNRKLQMKLIALAMLLELSLMGFYEYSIKSFSEGTYSAGSFVHLFVMLFFILALRGIRKDNKIIAESSRLR